MNKVTAALIRARALQKEGKLLEAGEIYQEVLNMDPGNPAAWTGRAEVCALRGLVEEAMHGFEKALDAESAYYPALLGLARLLIYLGEPEDALEELQLAEETGPDSAELQLLTAYAYLDMHWNKEGADHLRKALELDPTLPGVEEQITRISSETIPLWHFTMLVDHARNEAYRQAIERAVKPGMHVLDIGAGTGLLSMMAARAGAERVTCVEMGKVMASVAKKVIEQNGYADRIFMHRMHSGWLRIGEHLPRKADVIVSEIVDAALLGEGVLPSLRHAWSSLAAPGAKMIPAAASVYGMLANVPVATLEKVEGFDLSALSAYHFPEKTRNIRVAHEAHSALSEPFIIEDFDFTQIPDELHDEQRIWRNRTLTASASGIANAVIVWFRLHLDDSISVGSGPKDTMDHWGQLCYFLPKPIYVHHNQPLVLKVGRNDKRWWFAT